jgi:hypothetical protein
MTHNNGIYHETTMPLTAKVKITINNVASEMTTAAINLITAFLHPTHTKCQGTRVRVGSMTIKT